jgi:hypothetical protein
MPDRLVQARSSSIEVNPTFLDYLLKYPLTILAERTWQWSKKPRESYNKILFKDTTS